MSPATVERAGQCKFKYIYQGHTEKIPILEEILADAKIPPEEVAYIGDDFTDVVVMRRVGLRHRHGQRPARSEADRALRHRRRAAAMAPSAKSWNCCSKRRASGTAS